MIADPISCLGVCCYAIKLSLIFNVSPPQLSNSQADVIVRIAYGSIYTTGFTLHSCSLGNMQSAVHLPAGSVMRILDFRQDLTRGFPVYFPDNVSRAC